MEATRQPAIAVPANERNRRALFVSMKPKHKMASSKRAKLREKVQNESGSKGYGFFKFVVEKSEL